MGTIIVSNLDMNIVKQLETLVDEINTVCAWVNKPDKMLFERLQNAHSSFKSIIGVVDSDINIYRGLSLSNENQDRMGMTPAVTTGDILTYNNNTNPLSFTTDISVAKQYGAVVVESSVCLKYTRALVLTDEIMYLVSKINGVEPFTENEVILLPPYDIIFKILSK